MARNKREWKAWMVVNKRGSPRGGVQWYKRWLVPEHLLRDGRIIRVRIVEE